MVFVCYHMSGGPVQEIEIAAHLGAGGVLIVKLEVAAQGGPIDRRSVRGTSLKRGIVDHQGQRARRRIEANDGAVLDQLAR
jgi:hypothetical protein